jgi:hypothetical protein
VSLAEKVVGGAVAFAEAAQSQHTAEGLRGGLVGDASSQYSRFREPTKAALRRKRIFWALGFFLISILTTMAMIAILVPFVQWYGESSEALSRQCSRRTAL